MKYMNVPPRLNITLVFNTMQAGYKFKITKYLNKYNLHCEGFTHYTKNDLYFFTYILEGIPENLIKFLCDKSVTSHLI